MQDYLLRNQRLAAKNGAISADLARSRSALAPAFLKPVLTVRPAYIEAAFTEVDNAYADKGRDLIRQEISALKAKLLSC